MKRSPPPARKTPLPRQSKPLRRTAMKQGARKPIGQRGAKAEREQPALDAFRAAILVRSRGLCEGSRGGIIDGQLVTVAHSHTARKHPGGACHHLYPEDRDSGRHDPARGLLLCTACHSWAHANPKHAKTLGLLRPDLP